MGLIRYAGYESPEESRYWAAFEREPVKPMKRLDKEGIRAAFSGGMSVEQIVKVFDTTDSSARKALQGLLSKAAPRVNAAEVRRLADEGLSKAEIARRLGCHASTVARALG